jgi:hypothetical protein
MVREITLRQFNAYCYVRSPFLNVILEEICWFEAFRKKIVATIVLDKIDKDFGFVILGRDNRKIFRAIHVEANYETFGDAKLALFEKLKEYENDGNDVYPQGDEKKLPNEFLIPKVSKEKLHPYFLSLIEHDFHQAAKQLINEIVYSFYDVDGNFIKDFQTTGFDARLWELYLYVYLYSAGFEIDKSYNAPDFMVSFCGRRYAIEAVTVNKSEKFDEPNPKDAIDAYRLSLDYMPIKFGSSLVSKLQKKYWEKKHVKGMPLIFAIHDFHQASTVESLGSMVWSRNALIDYLYGVRQKYSEGETGEITFNLLMSNDGVEGELEKIEEHSWKGKKIPSNFFSQPESENVSAILFSNNATIATFNRMGTLAGLGDNSIKILRHCTHYDADPHAYLPIMKVYDISDPAYEEFWGDGLVLYHNPNAKYPIDRVFFPDVSHVYYDEVTGSIYSYTRPYDVLNSFTMVLIKK